MRFITFPIILGVALAAPAPSKTLEERATQQCGQYQSQSSGAYTLATNGWGWQYATSGSQCSEIDGISGNSISWDTTWTWAGGPTNVKSYTNVQSSLTQKQLSAYTSIPTTWKWTYTGTNLQANGKSGDAVVIVALKLTS
jgi:xyloglucan-specific endo-beta-1,4-glucanase